MRLIEHLTPPRNCKNGKRKYNNYDIISGSVININQWHLKLFRIGYWTISKICRFVDLILNREASGYTFWWYSVNLTT